ncbi:IclR family transcriptional regulator C-terminal domain-containing protein [Pseudooceanicola sp.]|uniref:IclR family transcriptional regulator domain-containing protein n=1 Tax=Pseudooceanicola sp. TaxID=1914328 RepID=UPI002625D749|nr:IclR family transcriptional regulator C-terminal domain-containing protein [Pseudooceanicola sp.]MDF1855085.1 IclR family transcriptional regulator C-terminal domain-containing protein [Pseudooceanicola sp.]
MAQRVPSTEPVPDQIIRLGKFLRNETSETVCIGAAAGQSVVFLEVIDSPARIRYAAEVGQYVPIHATASGWSILSQWPAKQRASLLRKVEFERYGSGTPLSVDAVEDRIYAITVAGPLTRVEDLMPDIAARMHQAIAVEFGANYLTQSIKGFTSPPIPVETEPGT